MKLGERGSFQWTHTFIHFMCDVLRYSELYDIPVLFNISACKVNMEILCGVSIDGCISNI